MNTIKNEQNAKELVKAIKTIAEKPENLNNLECYLTYHFSEWLKKIGNTPEKLTSEMKMFAEMEI